MSERGTVVAWRPAQAYGFIRPHAGGADLFVHASAFAAATEPPAVGDVVSYTLATDGDGRPHASAPRIEERAAPAAPRAPVGAPARTSSNAGRRGRRLRQRGSSRRRRSGLWARRLVSVGLVLLAAVVFLRAPEDVEAIGGLDTSDDLAAVLAAEQAALDEDCGVVKPAPACAEGATCDTPAYVFEPCAGGAATETGGTASTTPAADGASVDASGPAGGDQPLF